MPQEGHTLVFPRTDNLFKKKESLSFEEAHSNVWTERPNGGEWECWKEWLAYQILGVFVGIVAWFMTLNEDFLSEGILHLMIHRI